MAKTPNAFADVRSDVELLASGRLPKSVRYLKKIPLPPKVRAMITKVGAEPGNPNASASAAATVLRGASKYAAAATATKIAGAIGGKFAKGLSSISRLMAMASLGAVITEEADPRKLKRPLFGKREGSIVNAAQAAQSLVNTNMASLLNSLISGVPLAVGLPPKFKIFKSLLALQKSPRYFDSTLPPATPSPGDPHYTPVGGPDAVIVAQRGLLEDEIAYRMTLIAENVIVPLRQHAATQNYGPLVILEGFRAENSGISPHERGEAVDLTLGNGSLSQSESLYRMAIWARDNLIYDQLVLCYSNIAGGQAWLHVTFTPEGRRRQVFTKPFNDVHVSGLHWYDNYTDASVRAQDAATLATSLQVASSISAILAARDARLNPVGVNTPETSATPVDGSDGSGNWNGVDPEGHVYVPDNQHQDRIVRLTEAMLAEPVWRITVGEYLRDDSFARELLRRCYADGAPSTGVGAIGLNGKRGGTETSKDALAILNPTGSQGAGSWASDGRVQIVDFLGSSDNPEVHAQYGDVTYRGTAGGRFIAL